MTYKVISTDLDGTLLTSKKTVSKKTLDILNEYKRKGIKIVGITARNLSSISNVMDISLFDYIILNNGAYIVDVSNMNIENTGCMSREELEIIDNLFQDKHECIDFCTLNYYYQYKTRPNHREFEVEINSIDEVKEDVARMNIVLPTRDDISYYKNYIKEQFPDLNVVAMEDTDSKNTRLWITVTSKKISKLNSLIILIKRLNISLEEVIFFGDGENDLELIKNVGRGIAMGNAIDSVKEQASEVTSSNDEDGIYEALLKIKQKGE